MSINMIVCVKQVIDPEMPSSAFEIDETQTKVRDVTGIPPVINGFDENAIEAALRIKDQVGGTIKIVSVGTEFEMGVLKKPLSMGADDLIIVQDDAFSEIDAYATAQVLTAAIKKVDQFDLIICGRQASDWDNSLVPIGVAEFLSIPCVTVAQNIEVVADGVIVKRVLDDGHEIVEARLPLLITVSNELGEPRYPTLRGIMAAGRKEPIMWSASDLFADKSFLAPKLRVTKLSIPTNDQTCEFIQGESDEDSGRLLALKLHKAGLI